MMNTPHTVFYIYFSQSSGRGASSPDENPAHALAHLLPCPLPRAICTRVRLPSCTITLTHPYTSLHTTNSTTLHITALRCTALRCYALPCTSAGAYSSSLHSLSNSLFSSLQVIFLRPSSPSSSCSSISSIDCLCRILHFCRCVFF